MDKIIEWYNAGETIILSVIMGDIFNCNIILTIDNISIYNNIINIMSGEINIDLCFTDLVEKEDGLYYTEGNTTMLLTI